MLDSIELVTLNCWGLKFISQLTDDRIKYIAEELASGTSDIVCLQEIWQQKHWQIIQTRLRDRFPHSKFFRSGMIGSGLAILSKYPIIQTDMRPYTLNGRPQAFFRGDWFVGKGIASAVIQLPNGRECQVFNTHMHAPYNESVDTYLCHRIAQAWEMHKMLQTSVRSGYLTFATGDFNSVPGSLVHSFLRMHLFDSFISLNPNLPLLPDLTLSSQELVDRFGTTCDVSPLNTWRQTHAPSMTAKRLDYIFHDHRTIPETVDVIFTNRVPFVGCSASDHFGVRCRYKFMADQPIADRPLTQRDFDDICRQLNWYVAREARHSKLRLLHFWASVGSVFYLLYLTLLIRSPFAQFQIACGVFILTFTGLLSGLVGSIFGWWELRSLAEFEDEIKLARGQQKAPLTSE